MLGDLRTRTAGSLTTFYHRLTWVNATDPWMRVQRQNIAIISALAFLLNFLSLLATLAAGFFQQAIFLLGFLGVCVVVWGINRHSIVGAWLLIIATISATVIALPIEISHDVVSVSATYLFGLIIAARILDTRGILGVLLFQILLTLLVATLRSHSSSEVARIAVAHTLTLSGATAMLIMGAGERRRLIGEVEQARTRLLTAYDATLEGWGKAVDLRDKETGNHSKRVADATRELAVAYGIKGQDLINLWRGAILHDVGKLGVPDAVLLKPGKLTEEEWVMMRAHTLLAEHFLSGIDFLEPCMDIPRCHHERWDGSGYPYGMAGLQIPIAARMFAIIDVHDALTSNRPYRAANTDAEARLYIREQAGILFDPDLVNLFLVLGQEEKRAAMPANGLASNARGA